MIPRLLLAMLLAATALPAQTVNCLVAVVNGHAVTLLDVQIAAEFGLGYAAGEGEDPRRRALDALVDRKIVLDLARENRGLTGEEIDAAIDELARSLGAEAFAAKVAKFGMRPADLGPYVEERVIVERALAVRFSASIPVALTEIERTYRDIYVPERGRLGLPVEPFDRVAGDIERQVREDRLDRQTADWLRDLRRRANIQYKKDCLQ
ncbi:MAG: hypothetical protein KA243_08690 [Candidatus Aminicenantes bacterium]|nr:hypothetical protein [Candidatus Aminicenantes bacterium]NLH75541.1 hypothetical protein [Acidobacteriota bacterium]